MHDIHTHMHACTYLRTHEPIYAHTPPTHPSVQPPSARTYKRMHPLTHLHACERMREEASVLRLTHFHLYPQRRTNFRSLFEQRKLVSFVSACLWWKNLLKSKQEHKAVQVPLITIPHWWCRCYDQSSTLQSDVFLSQNLQLYFQSQKCRCNPYLVIESPYLKRKDSCRHSLGLFD